MLSPKKAIKSLDTSDRATSISTTPWEDISGNINDWKPSYSFRVRYKLTLSYTEITSQPSARIAPTANAIA